MQWSEQYEKFLSNNSYGKSVAKLAVQLGPAATIGAATFAAFVLGSIWVDLIPNGARRAIRIAKTPMYFFWIWRSVNHGLIDKAISFIDSAIAGAGESRIRDAIGSMVRQRVMMRVAEDGDFADAVRGQLKDFERNVQIPLIENEGVFQVVDVNRHVTEILRNIDNVPMRLLGAEPDLWNTWDRIRAEGEFRTALATALIPLGVVLAHNISQWNALIVLISICLWVLGNRKMRQAKSMIYDALVSGRVSMPELERFNSLSSTYGSRRTTYVQDREIEPLAQFHAANERSDSIEAANRWGLIEMCRKHLSSSERSWAVRLRKLRFLWRIARSR
ncbi:hypothetical protein Aglo01_41680 [Actinokineospora globicatena]|nr:hypothetical protein Aglo01_41680 [Actinokineospora globicatena]GLW85903.1 hypothetical protein Aglo02_35430 [Actinokineospora globicatena]